MEYTRLPGLSDIVLEESWVLDIEVGPGLVRFLIEAVLTDSHPMHEPCHPGEQFCYKKCTWKFCDVRSVAWTMGGGPAIDASGELDYGHIDEVAVEPPIYTVTGDFGWMRILSSEPGLVLMHRDGEAVQGLGTPNTPRASAGEWAGSSSGAGAPVTARVRAGSPHRLR